MPTPPNTPVGVVVPYGVVLVGVLVLGFMVEGVVVDGVVVVTGVVGVVLLAALIQVKENKKRVTKYFPKATNQITMHSTIA